MLRLKYYYGDGDELKSIGRYNLMLKKFDCGDKEAYSIHPDHDADKIEFEVHSDFGLLLNINNNENLLSWNQVLLSSVKGPPPRDNNHYKVGYINGLEEDNRISNLYWQTSSYVAETPPGLATITDSRAADIVLSLVEDLKDEVADPVTFLLYLNHVLSYDLYQTSEEAKSREA